jgi:hypothetical protein
MAPGVGQFADAWQDEGVVMTLVLYRKLQEEIQ